MEGGRELRERGRREEGERGGELPFELSPCLGNGCVMRVCKLIRSGQVRTELTGPPDSESSLTLIHHLHPSISIALKGERGCEFPAT